jgi:hypothetical protein
LSPKDLGAPCESPALFAGEQTARLARILISYCDAYDDHN